MDIEHFGRPHGPMPATTPAGRRDAGGGGGPQAGLAAGLSWFPSGTLIRTAAGDAPVEDIAAGQTVLTRDNGFQPVREVVHRRVSRADHGAVPSLRPVEIAPSALGQHQPSLPLRVLPAQRILLNGFGEEFPCAAREVLMPASKLLGWDGVSQPAAADAIFVHLALAACEILLANGAWTECSQPPDTSDAPGSIGEVPRGPEFAQAPSTG